MTATMLTDDDCLNPLDIAERVIMDRDWAFDRPDESELLAEAAGTCGKYNVWLAWQEDCGGLTLTCALDAKFAKAQGQRIHTLLALVNEKLWLGHFDINPENSTVAFRHSLLLREGAGTTAEHLRELLDIAIEECDRFYPAFQSVIWGGKTPAEALAISLFETIAEA
jgi:hypothetical protein